MTSVDLPEPDTPVTEVSTPSGNDTSISRRLCSRAPTTVSCRRAVDRPADRGHLDALLARQVGAGDRVRVAQQLGVGAAVHDRAAVLAGRRADVDHPVGMRDGVLVVLDDDQRVAEIP